MAEHPTVARARSAFEDFRRGDLDAYRHHFSQQVVCHLGGSNPLCGDHQGHAELLAYLTRLNRMAGGTLEVELQEIVADDTHAGVFTRLTAKRAGHSLDVVLAQAFELDEAGAFIEYWALANDQEALDAFCS